MHARRLSLVCLLAILALPPAGAAAATISGRVMDSSGKGIADAVVFVQSASGKLRGGSPPAAVMDQVNKTFVPGLLPIVVGTRVRFPNHDQIQHHVYSFSPAKNFELPLYKGDEAPAVLFDKVGVVKIGCNIHDWMSGIILVLPTAHFSVTDADGRFTLTDLPGGSYDLAAWHALSKIKPQDTAQSVQVDANPTDVQFRLSLAAPRGRPAVNGARGEP